MHVPSHPLFQQAAEPPAPLQPSPVFLDAVQGIGERLCLDATDLGQGRPFEIEGRTFWIEQALTDPQGLVLFMHMGTLPQRNALSICRALLEQNAAMPVNSGGFAILPGTDDLVFRQRLDLERLPAPAEAFMQLLHLLSLAPEQLNEGIQAARSALQSGTSHRSAGASGGLQ